MASNNIENVKKINGLIPELSYRGTMVVARNALLKLAREQSNVGAKTNADSIYDCIEKINSMRQPEVEEYNPSNNAGEESNGGRRRRRKRKHTRKKKRSSKKKY